jgi:membrane protease YdiL (CAAX protease family)
MAAAADWTRRLIGRHPLGAFLIIGNAVYVASVLVTPVREGEIWFGLPLSGVVGGLLGVGAAAFLVTAAADGREGVRDLLARTFRWRVPIRWYLLALFLVPAGTMLLALAFFGTEALESPADGWPHVVGVVLGVFVLQLLLFQLSEEVGWTGFFQERLSSRYSPLKLCAVVAFWWALWHLPDFFADEGWGVEPVVSALVFFVVEFVLLFFARVLITWIYVGTGRSILLVVVFHASFDATISELAKEVIPASNAVRFLLVTAITVAAAVAVIVATRGRLGREPSGHGRAAIVAG